MAALFFAGAAPGAVSDERARIDALPASGPTCVAPNPGLAQSIHELRVAREIHYQWHQDLLINPSLDGAEVGDVEWQATWVKIYDQAITRICAELRKQPR